MARWQSACNAADLRSVPGPGRPPGEGMKVHSLPALGVRRLKLASLAKIKVSAGLCSLESPGLFQLLGHLRSVLWPLPPYSEPLASHLQTSPGLGCSGLLSLLRSRVITWTHLESPLSSPCVKIPNLVAPAKSLCRAR